MSKKIVYRLQVSASMALSDDEESVDFYTLEQATNSRFKRDLEIAMFNCLKRMEPECDVELMDFTVEDDE